MGGQAVLDGVMMKAEGRCAVSVRCPDGSIQTELVLFQPLGKRHPILGLPLIRGFINFCQMLALGQRVLSISVVLTDPEPEQTASHVSERLFTAAVWIFAVVLSVGLFMLLPASVVKLGGRLLPLDSVWLKNIVEGLVRICVLLTYLLLTSLMPDMRRAFEYYGTWKIVDPILFLQTVRDNIGAEARLLDVFSSSLSVQLGQYKLEQLVNTDAEKLELDTMIADTVAYAKERAAEYGIEVVDAQIRVLNFPEANKQSVYDRMSAEREQMAQRYRSEGSEEASNIRANAEKEQQLILAEAYQKVQEIMGEGDAEAIRIYGEAFQKDPEFYEFIRTLETYEKTIDGNTTLILPSTSEILKYLGGSGN